MKRLFVILLPLLLAACTLIDDDLSVCGKQVLINYQLQLHTELSVQLQAELATEPELPVRRALERWLAPIFVDTDIDVDLRFYSAEQDELEVHRTDTLRDRHTSFTVILPKENYMHLAVANVHSSTNIELLDDEHSSTLHLSLPDEPEHHSLEAGIFSSRLPIEVSDTMQELHVMMYMINSAVVLVMDTTACSELAAIDGYVSGAANGFAVYDSIYDYSASRAVRMDRVPMAETATSVSRRARTTDNVPYACVAAAVMPTQDSTAWHITLTSTLSGNRHTSTTLTIDEPLQAGSLRLFKLAMGEDGGLTPVSDNTEVGATVELDWKKGDDHDIEI